MKFHLRSAAVVLALATGIGVAAAQTTGADTKLQLTDAQKTQIYRSLQSDMDRNTSASPAPAPGAGVELRVGAALPATVTLQDIPSQTVAQVPAMARYKFVMFGDEVAIVDPGSRQIVEILSD